MRPLFVELRVSSPDIAPLGAIGDLFCHDRGNRCPVIEVGGVPKGTVDLALICHDADASRPRGATHWLAYGLGPDDCRVGPGGVDAREGLNCFGERGWGGPRPPAGHGPHHYYFWVYALARLVVGEPDRDTFLEVYGDAVIEQARLVGVHAR